LLHRADLGEATRAPIGYSAANAATNRWTDHDVSTNEGTGALAHHVPQK
jgi:hypothetical protein